MMNKVVFIIAVSIFLLSCSLDRDNPVDPHQSSSIQVQTEETNIFVVKQYDLVSISWNGIADIDGFYIYRSMSYNGFYERLPELENTVTTYEDTNVEIADNIFYWYKLSAFINIGEDKLEGIRSDPHIWN